MIEYMVPDFICGQTLYTTLYNLQNSAPHMLYENSKISFIYGCVPNAIWNGGSVILDDKIFHRSEVKQYIHYYNEILNLPIAWTFTNPLLEETDCYDRYCNMLAEVGHTGKNYILVSSPILENYLRKHYPNYKYCRSIIAAKDIPAIYDDPKYAYTVLKRSYNADMNYLNSIPLQFRSKIELLATDHCPPNCPRIYTHYNAFAKAQLTYDYTIQGLECTEKQYSEGNPLVITKEMIDNIYYPMGFTHFKLSGRGDMNVMIDNVVQYFIKPDYQELVSQLFKEEFLKEVK